MHKLLFAFIFLFFINMCSLFAQDVPVTLVKEINKQLSTYIPEGAQSTAAIGNVLFFGIDDASNGIELWKSDGTSSGTSLVKDINPGIADSGPNFLVPFKNIIYFFADDELHGFEMWKTDGTADGTVLVKEFTPGPQGFSPDMMKVVGDKIFIFGASALDYTKLQFWTSDGTEAGTVQVDIQGVERALDGIVLNGKLLFTGQIDINAQLWVTDGTVAGTAIVSDLFPDYQYTSSTGNSRFVPFNGKVYFTAFDGTSEGLFATDGTSAGTVEILAEPVYSLTANSTGLYYFLVDDTGVGVWQSDGVSATQLVSGFFGYVDLYADGSTVYFSSAQSSDAGVELWKTTGTPEGAIMLKDIELGSGSSMPQYFSKVNGLIYFQATTTANGTEIWRTDGTSEGTEIAEDILAGPASTPIYRVPDPVNAALFFANDNVHGTQLWASNGTLAGTSMITDIGKAEKGSDAFGFTSLNGKLYFSANEQDHGQELWVTDGTPAGTLLVDDINPGANGSDPDLDSQPFGTLVFTAFDGSNWNLYSSDGTSAGTNVIESNFLGYSMETQGTIKYFLSILPGNQLWTTDGTAAGTKMLIEFGPLFSEASSYSSTQVANGMVFDANQSANGTELWKSDGTSAGTVLIKDINPGAPSSNPSSFVTLDNLVFFSADDGTAGIEPWITDGTAAGSLRLADINAGAANSSPYSPTVYETAVYFYAYDQSTGTQFWKSDGTAAGTSKVMQITTGATPVDPFSMIVYRNELYFSGNDTNHGMELWKLNATGASLFADLNPGIAGSNPAGFTIANDTLFLNGINEAGEVSTWYTNGTTAGTHELVFTPALSCYFTYPYSSASILKYNNKFLISAIGATYGREIYSFTIPVPTVTGLAEHVDALSVFPNPSAGSYEVAGIEAASASVFVLDSFGRKVHQSNMPKSNDRFSFDISSLPAGVYILKLNFDNQLVTRKIVKR